ncbi:MAG TPA: HoxN/HupN/NixA family nickel/cobalt transporter [Solirubrobacterales bacterium]
MGVRGFLTTAAAGREVEIEAISSAQRRSLAGMAAVIVGLHVVGFFLLLVVVAPSRYSLGASGAFTVGVGVAAYTLGMRHAFDADHIAAIDNSTRKLMGEGKRPLSVGFFFSLGHSTIVFALAFLFALGIRALSSQVESGGSTLHDAGGWIGTGISGTFLYVIAGLNIAILVGILRTLGEMKRGAYDEAELERQLDNRGLMNRFYRRFTKTIDEPWQMYPIGVLFGLGFDTATEVGLLFLAAAGAGSGLPFYAIVCLPVLFAAGMTLFDTIDGSFMNFAYGWAFSKPVRKIYYNLTITALSVFVALAIGSIEIAGLLAQKLGLSGGAWDRVAALDLNTLGFLVAGVFVLTWVLALAIWRFAGIEERWSASIDRR